MQRFELEIVCRNCKAKNHAQCISKTSNLENFLVIINCLCDCNQEKNQAIDRVAEPASIVFSASTSEDSKEDG